MLACAADISSDPAHGRPRAAAARRTAIQTRRTMCVRGMVGSVLAGPGAVVQNTPTVGVRVHACFAAAA
jgi:hypothetical protein